MKAISEHDAKAVECPWCSAAPGSPCTYAGGQAAFPHAQRFAEVRRLALTEGAKP